MENFFGNPHRRLNRLTGEYVLVSPHRTQRPWLGQVDQAPGHARPAYDPSCYLCPGNERAGGARNPGYAGTFLFDNDFSALLPGTAPAQWEREGLLLAETERGVCRVPCYSPRHDLTWRHGIRGDPQGGGRVGGAICRIGRASLDPACADF